MESERIKILLVEDDRVDQMAFERFAKEEGLPYDYVIAGSVFEGKDILGSNRFDVVVMDYSLGDGTALDLFEDVNPDIPIVVATGSGNEDIAVEAMKAGCTDYIVKDPLRNYLKILPATVNKAIKSKMMEKELKRYQEQLKESEEKYRSLVNSMKDVIVRISPSGKLLYVSPSIYGFGGYDPESVIGNNMSKYFENETDMLRAAERLAEAIKTRQSGEFEFLFKPKNKKPFYVEHTYLPIVKDGKVIVVQLVLRDINDRKLAEDALRKREDQIIRSERLAASGQLAASIAHEINSPLQAVTFLLGSMEERWKNESELMESIVILQGAFRSIRDTVGNLLDLNRPGKDEKAQTHVNKVLEQTLDLLEHKLMRNRIKVNLALSPELPAIIASPQQLSHLFINLINNAAEAMTGALNLQDGWKKRTTGGEINMSTTASQGSIVITVADTGPGISEKDLQHIFDPFYTRKKRMGMGVGLSICNGFVEDHGGTIVAENGVGGGAVFTITLPIEKFQN